MTTSEERRKLLEHLEAKEFRDALVEADIANGILFQLKAMLADRGWTQEQLAEKAGTSQPVISKYFKGYENFSQQTLRKLASAFDVSLTTRFEPFSDLAERHLNVSWANLAIPDFPNDAALRAPVSEYASASSTAIPGLFMTKPFIGPTNLTITVEQQGVDVDCAWVEHGSNEPWLFEPETGQEKKEEAYATAA